MGRWIRVVVATMVMTGSALAYDLDQHLWRDRILVLAAPGAGDADLQRQRLAVAHYADAVVDRDLRVFVLSGRAGTRDATPLDADAVARLRDAWGLPGDARAMLLVGKDGGVKMRAPLEGDIRDVFAEIDRMPMRRDEMRRRPPAGPRALRPD